MAHQKLNINADRLQTDLEALGQIGRSEEDRGIYRMAFNEADMEARRWLMQKLKDADLESHMDGAGNVFGRFPDSDEQPAVLVGSHLDTVPAGGPLDGALGVVVGLECLRRIREERIESGPIELVGFSDEEGRFGGGFFGSRALCGDLVPETLHQAVDLEGTTLFDAMAEQGLDPMAALSARRSPDQFKAYVELHIEQGPVLAAEHKPVGVVEKITGLFRWQILLIGQADHAGTTPMPMRRNALAGLTEFDGEIPRLLEEHGGEYSVATIGSVQLYPGSANTVPGQVEFTLDVRDPDVDVLSELADAMRRTLSAIARRRGLMFEFDMLSDVAPTDCHESVIKTIANAAEQLGIEYRHMHSGAGHDAGVMARLMPIGMIFVPSVEGRSHSPAEWSHMEDIVTGANVMLNTLVQLSNDNI